jgi:hypothetical protein
VALAAQSPRSFASPAPHSGQHETGSGESPIVLELGSYRSGDSPPHRLTLAVTTGDPEIYSVQVTYPAGFVIRGFQRPDGSAVGAFEVDADADGHAEQVVPLVSLATRSAFADIIPDGTYSADLEPAVLLTADTRIELRLPLGGDANSDSLAAQGAARVSLVLAEGVVQNPSLGGRHVVAGELISVDPDTDGGDDGTGGAPVRRTFEVPLTLEGPRLVRFAALVVRDFDVFLHGRQADRFELEGRFALARRSDGIDPAREDLTLTVGNFRQTIPGRALVRTGHGYRFRGRAPGIVALTLTRDGHFTVETRRLQWDVARRTPVRVALQIGNDTGATFAVDRRKPPFQWWWGRS